MTRWGLRHKMNAVRECSWCEKPFRIPLVRNGKWPKPSQRKTCSRTCQKKQQSYTILSTLRDTGVVYSPPRSENQRRAAREWMMNYNASKQHD